MTAVSMKELLESGVHFGHQTRRWNPRMKPYIFTERGGIYIIDLQKTIRLIDVAFDFIKDLAANGKTVLFVGTKKQCQDTIAEEAQRCGIPFVSRRWLGGLLTNFSTISGRIRRMHELRNLRDNNQLELLPKREQMDLLNELKKLEANLGGVADMDKLPEAVFVVDPRREAIVIKEARKLHIPIVALVDTNCDPDEVDYVIPGNDDAIRSCGLIIRAMADAILEGKQLLSEKEMRASAERAAAEAKAAAEAAVKAAEEAEATAEAPTAKPETEAAPEAAPARQKKKAPAKRAGEAKTRPAPAKKAKAAPTKEKGTKKTARKAAPAAGGPAEDATVTAKETGGSPPKSKTAKKEAGKVSKEQEISEVESGS
ncbi:MAG: 30S ribosomal protein S2 [Thermoleophilia bacterium]|nr:30S ribosomal protein S2 [Thermoleophilia bacterium]